MTQIKNCWRRSNYYAWNLLQESAIFVTCSFSISHDLLFGPVIKHTLFSGKFKHTRFTTWICSILHWMGGLYECVICRNVYKAKRRHRPRLSSFPEQILSDFPSCHELNIETPVRVVQNPIFWSVLATL